MEKDKIKHCHNCQHLGWEEGDNHDDCGFVCYIREYTSDEKESEHLRQLEFKKYRYAPKKCCVLKNSDIAEVK